MLDYHKIIETNIMSRSYLLPQQQQRINPQFKGIAQKYSKLRKQRLQVDQRKQSIENNLLYNQRAKQTLDLTLQQKKQQLKWLKSVRNRYLTDLRQKIQRQENNNKNLQNLRMQSQYARKMSRKNIHEAILSSKKQKLKATTQVKNQLEDIKRMKQLKRQQMEMFYTLRSKQKQQEKSQSKNKINKFYRRKNKFLLNSYRQMIKNQQLMTQQSIQQIDFLQTQSNKIGSQLSKKKNKLKSIEDQINLIKLEAGDSRVRGFSIDLSRISKKSSKPCDILMKQSFTTGIPTQSK